MRDLLDAILHAGATLLAVVAGAQPAVPPADRQAAVRDFALTDTRQSAAALATYGGVVAWWGTAGDPADVRLTVWEPGGAPRRLPLRANANLYRRVLDVGRGPDGAVWVTYVRCVEREGSGPRCRPRGYDLRTGADRDLGVGPGIAAAIWGSEVAILRQARPGGPAALYVTTAGVVARRRLTLAPDEAIGEPEALDLRAGRVALTAWEAGEDARALSLFAGTLAEPGAIRAIDRGGSGEECTRLVTSPTLTATALTWMTSKLGPASTCGGQRRDLHRRDTRTGATLVAPIPRAAPKQAVVAAGRVVSLAVARPDGDQRDRDACDPQWLLDAPDARGCQLRVTGAPRWRPEQP